MATQGKKQEQSQPPLGPQTMKSNAINNYVWTNEPNFMQMSRIWYHSLAVCALCLENIYMAL